MVLSTPVTRESTEGSIGTLRFKGGRQSLGIFEPR
jgi:hypothetical protein